MEVAEIGQLKSAYRQRHKEFSASITSEDRSKASLAIAELLTTQKIWKNATTILFYAALKTEVNLSSLLSAALSEGKTVALPRFDPETGSYVAARLDPTGGSMVKGSFGVLEPSVAAPALPWNLLDLALVPGVAFDLFGVRLGRGKGFYDRMLVEVHGTKCGVAYEAQVVPQLPSESHDVRMNCLVTPTRWIDFPREGP